VPLRYWESLTPLPSHSSNQLSSIKPIASPSKHSPYSKKHILTPYSHLIQMPSVSKDSSRHWETRQGCLHSYGHPLSRRCAKSRHITQNSNEMDCQKKETTEDARREFASKTWENSRIESSLSEGRSSVIRPSQLYSERTLTLPLYKKPFKPEKPPNYRF
jgi:hypothetical protein